MTSGEESEEDRLRAELVTQLMESLAKSRGMILNDKMDVRTRERWTELHTRTAQVLNQILRDRQFKEWEKRLNEMETADNPTRKSVQPARSVVPEAH